MKIRKIINQIKLRKKINIFKNMIIDHKELKYKYMRNRKIESFFFTFTQS